MSRLAAWGLIAICWGCGVAPEADERQGLLKLAARGYYPGRSGQIVFVPEPGEIVLRKPMGLYRFMHGSPWEYDRHIPLVLYGPGFVTAGEHGEAVHQQDIAPTLLSLVGAERPGTMSGRALDFAIRKSGATPRVAAVWVLDGMRADYFERYGNVMPTLSRLARDGASFDNAWVNYVPTVTSAGHATIATGAEPRIHGIGGSAYYDASRNRVRSPFEGRSPENVMVPTLADIWSLHTNGDGVIIAQGTTPPATVSLAGHGKCMPDGRPAIVTIFGYRRETWVTNDDCYVIPEYLTTADARAFWERAGAGWRGVEIDDGRVFVMTPLFPEFQADALVSMIEREAIGRDDVPDLLLASFKSPDYVAHNFGPDSDETKEVLAALDVALGRVLDALEAAAGPRGYVIAITADHGMPSEPDGTNHQRRFIGEMMAAIHDALDPEGRLLYPFFETANHQLYLNRERLDELDLDLGEVAAVVEDLPYVRAAFSEDEIRAAGDELGRPHSP